MAMGGRWDPTLHCPNRGPALGHIRDTRVRPDGSCVYGCGYGKPKPNVCRGLGCVESVGGDFCENCTVLRGQHAFSHRTEGHSHRVEMCPPCEAWQ